MTIASLKTQPSVQAQALAIVRAMESANAAKPSTPGSSTDVAKVAAGIKISARSAASLADLSETPVVKLGYTKEESKQFKTVIEGAQKYLDDLTKLAAEDPKTQSDADKKLLEIYTPDAIAAMQVKLNSVLSAYNNQELTFQSFAITIKGDVSINAKVLQANPDGSQKSILDFSFSQSMTKDKKAYDDLWLVDGQALLREAPKRVL